MYATQVFNKEKLTNRMETGGFDTTQ